MLIMSCLMFITLVVLINFMPRREDAYDQGRKACESGLSHLANPYKSERFRAIWLKGFCDESEAHTMIDLTPYLDGREIDQLQINRLIDKTSDIVEQQIRSQISPGKLHYGDSFTVLVRTTEVPHNYQRFQE